jgi:serine/threonine protein kinase
VQSLADQSICGFLMPRITDVHPVFQFYNPASRKKFSPLFHYGYLLRTARNLASSFHALHQKNYVVGDVNESNILVADTSLVTLVDTDSFQVREGATIHRCIVHKPEFTPPELHGKDFSAVDRAPEHDLFGLAVLIFRLLMEGFHPFDGKYRGLGDVPLVDERIRAGHFPYQKSLIVPYSPPDIAPDFQSLPSALRDFFVRCFVDGHRNPKMRPSANDWRAALDDAEKDLVTCSRNSQHHYAKENTKCPWCARKSALGRDPFPSQSDVKQGLHQQPLPAATKFQPTTGATFVQPTVGGAAHTTGIGTATGQAQNFPIGKVLWYGALGLAGLWLLSKVGTLFEGPSAIMFNNPVIAQSIQNNQPVGATNDFPNAPATPAFYISYTNGRAGDEVGISVSSGGAQVAHCNDIRLTGPSGYAWCWINTTPLNAGSYAFNLSVNGKIMGTYPFTIESAPPATPSAPLETISPPSPPSDAQSVSIELNPGNTRDVWTTSVYSYAPGGGGPGGGLDNDQLRIGGWGDWYWSLMRFDLSGNPKRAEHVVLQLYNEATSAAATTAFDVYVIDQDWGWSKGDRLWWRNRPTLMHKIASVDAPSPNSWVSIDITDIYNAWQSGQTANYGIALIPKFNNNNFDQFRSSKYADESYRPRLLVTASQIPSSAPPSQPPSDVTGQPDASTGGQTIQCVLPSGQQVALSESDCRARSGVIYN